jgi:hypothetical protein
VVPPVLGSLLETVLGYCLPNAEAASRCAPARGAACAAL